jgi:hypothetical protein
MEEGNAYTFVGITAIAVDYYKLSLSFNALVYNTHVYSFYNSFFTNCVKN